MTDTVHDAIIKLIRTDIKRIRLDQPRPDDAPLSESNFDRLAAAVRSEDQIEFMALLSAEDLPTLYATALTRTLAEQGFAAEQGAGVEISPEEMTDLWEFVTCPIEEAAITDADTLVVAATAVGATEEEQMQREVELICKMTLQTAFKIAQDNGTLIVNDGVPSVEMSSIEAAAKVVADQTGVDEKLILHLITSAAESTEE